MFQKSFVFLFFLLSLSNSLFAQQEQVIQLDFTPKWQNEAIVLPFTTDQTTIEIFRCYVTHFELWNDDQLVWNEENSFHLLDAEIGKSMDIQLKVPQQLNFNQLKFQLGVDSTTNVSGAFGGDLDPTKGMFWAWNTGYINFKLEGSDPICPTRKNKFQFHLGGYAAPYQSVQNITLPISQKDKISIQIQLDQFLQKINLADKHSIMTPGSETVKLAKIAQQIFTVAYEK